MALVLETFDGRIPYRAVIRSTWPTFTKTPPGPIPDPRGSTVGWAWSGHARSRSPRRSCRRASAGNRLFPVLGLVSALASLAIAPKPMAPRWLDRSGGSTTSRRRSRSARFVRLSVLSARGWPRSCWSGQGPRRASTASTLPRPRASTTCRSSTVALRMDRVPSASHRLGAMRHRHDPSCLRPRSGHLAERAGAEPLFEPISRRYEHGYILIASNPPFEESA